MRTPGGIFLPVPEVRDQLAESVRPGQPLAAQIAGERFAVHASSGYFVTDPSTWLAELDDPYVLVTDTALATVEPLVPILEACAREARAILVCAPAITDDARLVLIINKLRGVLYVAAVDADPPTRARLAELTGADRGGMDHVTQLGRARRAVIAHDAMAIVPR